LGLVGSLRRAAVLFVVCFVLGGCTFPALRTATPLPTASPTRSVTAEPTASPTLGPTPDPTPNSAALPSFSAGEILATLLDGLRIRARPGLTSVVVTGLLPLGARLEAVMGPILVDGNGWFLVRDADTAEPQFEEGWVSTGFEPEPFLAATGSVIDASPYVASFAQTGNAEYGPVEIDAAEHLVRWIALDPERTRCELTVAATVGSAPPIPLIRATVGNGIDPGTLQPGAFTALGLVGQAFIRVESDCMWALVLMHPPPPETPSPSSSP
jgi:hypothetical protein